MNGFFRTKAGLAALGVFMLLMGFMVQRVVTRSLARSRAEKPAVEQKEAGASERTTARGESPDKAALKAAPSKGAASKASAVIASVPGDQQDLQYLDSSLGLAKQSRTDRDRNGRFVTKRRTASPVSGAKTEAQAGPAKTSTLRLKGRVEEGAVGAATPQALSSVAARPLSATTPEDQKPAERSATLEALRFCPYGRPIKCELVFTIDSTMEETPLVGLVMEPVYNNGQLVIPAGAELHGQARPDRLRDRIFSGTDWVLVMPREGGLANGRELRVSGVVLDRAETDGAGLSWGITDGSTGLQGAVIRTMDFEELKQFAATFLSAAAVGLEEQESVGRGYSRPVSSPANAALQGVSKVMEDTARKIAAEVERHGVFLRVAGGKPFYFYPQQAIRPSLARLPALAGKEDGL